MLKWEESLWLVQELMQLFLIVLVFVALFLHIRGAFQRFNLLNFPTLSSWVQFYVFQSQLLTPTYTVR